VEIHVRKVLVAVTSFAAVEYTNKTPANGLGGNSVNSVYVVGSTVYAVTAGS
jgi:hypothetical protein